jgi:hypothetical protein
LLLVVDTNLTPLSPLQPDTSREALEIFMAGEGSSGERAKPPLKFSPPLEQTIIREIGINLFERGIKGVSIKNQTYANSAIMGEAMRLCAPSPALTALPRERYLLWKGLSPPSQVVSCSWARQIAVKA